MRQNNTQKEVLISHLSIGFPCKQLLNEYLISLPLETLQNYPQKGWHWWMGKKSHSSQALELRDYILHWRYFQIEFRKKYSTEYLKTLSKNDLSSFVYTYLKETPFWAYEGPVRDGIRLLFCHSHQKE